MYSRSLDPRRVPQALPNHYGGSAFRSDGTPTPIPVKREHPPTGEPLRKNETAKDSPEDTSIPIHEAEDAVEELSAPERSESDSVSENAAFSSSEKEHTAEKSDASFLSRTLGALFPDLRTDDLLLLLLILLLSRESGNEDVLLILAVLLFGK